MQKSSCTVNQIFKATKPSVFVIGNIGSYEMAKYPFLSETGSYFKEQNFSLKDFGTLDDLAPFVEKAYDRIVSARDGKTYKSEIPKDGRITPVILQKEVFSFLLAVVLIKLAKANMLIQRFSLQEARTAEKSLENDLRVSDIVSGPMYLSQEKLHARELTIKIIYDISKVKISKPAQNNLSSSSAMVQNDDWLVSVFDYVTRAIHFHEREWELVNRRVHNGYVYLSSHEVVRLIRKEIETFIRTRIQSMGVSEMYPIFENYVKELSEWNNLHQPTFVSSSEYPPCIKHAIDILEKGENLPHSGRFMLATYLLGRDQSVSDIAPLFKNAPDYNEKITLYQLNNLSGQGSGTKYKCPSCDKVRSNDLCFAISECDNIINPLQFGRKRVNDSKT